ncbi:MAG: copper amine oxidase N-terminal domain-containing protein [Clostridia bacterium]|nr:copper amine oxidase N-terminal domain-containing protein [Clostridia bacterium]
MQKKTIGILLTVCLILGMLTALPAAAADVIEISTADELVKLMNQDGYAWNASYVLKNDIDMSGKAVAPIGTSGTPFTGTFDGNGKTVSGYTLALADTENVGFFGYVGSGAVIKNLTLDGSVTGKKFVGGIVGYATEGVMISGCTNLCDVIGTDATKPQIGGIVGFAYDANLALTTTIVDCKNAGNLTSIAADGTHHNDVGGIAGIAWGVVISACENTGVMLGENNIGGIVGRCLSSTVEKCVNSGEVQGNYLIGGVIGYIHDSSTVSQCMNSAKVTATTTSGNANTGGVVGAAENASVISDCLNTGDVYCYAAYAGGLIGQTKGTTTTSNCYSNGTVYYNDAALTTTEDDNSYIQGFCGFPLAKNFTACYYSSTGTPDPKSYLDVKLYALYSDDEFATLNSTGNWVKTANGPQLACFTDAASGVELKMTVGKTDYTLNGETKTMDVAPIIINDRTMLPVRYVAEALGAEIGWDGATSTATLKTADTEIKITVGAAEAIVNGQAVKLDSPAVIVSDRSFMPVRFVAETLGGTVAWDGATSTATITK